VTASSSTYGQQGGYPPPDNQQSYQDYPQPGYPPPGRQPHGGYSSAGHSAQRGYLEGGPVDFQSAMRLQLQSLTNFNGRASLSAYWWYALALFIVGMVLELLLVGIGSAPLSVLITLVMIAAALSGLSAGARRLHDSDKTGWLLLLGLIPFIGIVIVTALLVLPGTPGQNRFG
jgi:uncharacterized membrane protein YhaH (DUF805 family)